MDRNREVLAVEAWKEGFARWISDRCARFDELEEDIDDQAAALVSLGFDPGDEGYFWDCRVENLCMDWIRGGELDDVLSEALRLFREEHAPRLATRAEARAREMAANCEWDMLRA